MRVFFLEDAMFSIMKYLQVSPDGIKQQPGSVNFRITFHTGTVQGISYLRGYIGLLKKGGVWNLLGI